MNGQVVSTVYENLSTSTTCVICQKPILAGISMVRIDPVYREHVKPGEWSHLKCAKEALNTFVGFILNKRENKGASR